MNQGHTRFIVGMIFLLSFSATVAGTFLLYKGFQSGELLAQMGSNGLSGLVGFLGGKIMNDKLTASGSLAVETTNAPSNPVPVTEKTI